MPSYTNPLYYCPDGTTVNLDGSVPSITGNLWMKADSTLGWNNISGNIRNNIYIDKDTAQDVRIANTECAYIMIYNHLITEYPDRQIEWELLLKLNGNNYKETVLQIEDSLRKENVQ